MIIVKTLENRKIKIGTLADLKADLPVWADFEEPNETELKMLAEIVGMSLSDLKRQLDPLKRPMIFDRNGYSVIIFRTPRIADNYTTTKTVVFFVSREKHDFITVHPLPSGAIRRVKNYDPTQLGLIMQEGTGKLLYTILNEAVSSFYHILDAISRDIDKLEKKLLTTRPDKEVLIGIHRIKQTLIYFHRALIANRDVVISIDREYLRHIGLGHSKYFHSLYTDILQMIEIEATYREILTSALEIHLTQVSNYLNVTMKKITSWGAIILVPSLIASIFGMNFKYIPEANEPFGFFFALTLMLISILVLYHFFKKRDWL